MDLLSPCRSCLQCLPFFQVSPPSSPRPASCAPAEPSSDSPHEAASIVSASADSSRFAHEVHASTDVAALHATQEQDLPTSGQEEEIQYPSSANVEISTGSDLQSSVISENEALPVSEIIVAPPVSSASSYAAATTDEGVEITKTTAPTELPLHVPFINDISFATSGLMPLQSPMTPAPFGEGYGHLAGQYHPSPQIYPEGSDNSHDSKENLIQSSHFEHLNSYSIGHEHSHHGHGHPQSHGHHRHDISHNSDVYTTSPQLHSPPADTSVVDGGDVNDAITHVPLPSLETSSSTPECLGMEVKHDGQNGGIISEAPALIETYHSEPTVLSGIPDEDDDDSYMHEEGLGQEALHPGRRRRRRDHFKEQFKGISQQIKQGGHHLKEEGSKHLLTFVSNINKQAQQVEQSGSFFIVPRGNNS